MSLAGRRAKQAEVARTVVCLAGCGELIAPKNWRRGERCPKCNQPAVAGRN